MNIKNLIAIVRYLLGKPCRVRWNGWDYYKI